MNKQLTILVMMAVLMLAAVAASPVAGAANGQDGPLATHIIVFNDGVDAPGAANSLAKAHGLTVNNVYSHALSGMAAVVPDGRLKALAKDPRVAFVEANQVVKAFDIPTGIDRANADLNTVANINNDGSMVDVDIAIVDTGIDLDHPDLNVFRFANCARKGPMNTSCKLGDTGANDGNGHGTHVAGTAAAKDNGDSVVGMAPGARLWAVKVLGDDGSGWMNWIIGGIDFVAANAEEIEVANMSLGCECSSAALDKALDNVVAAGVTFAVAAGNNAKDAATFSPASNGSVITVSAIADFDGVPGGITDKMVAFSICTEDTDDSFACFSNYGSLIEIAAPGVNILSTFMGGGTKTYSGTSMASPHVAGAAALVKVANPSFTPAQVLAHLLSTGTNNDYTGDPDGTVEPLLNVANMTLGPQDPVANAGSDQSVTDTDQSGSEDVALDGSGSSDSDGSIATYEWSENGASIATGVNPTVAFTVGVHTVTLTVTDDDSPALTDMDDVVITVTVPDNTPPVIETVASNNITDTTADITWLTDELSDTVVVYGALNASAGDMVVGHLMGLSGLTAETTYYYEVRSTDGSGNTATDNNGGALYTFTTAAAPATATIVSASVSYTTSGGKNGDKNLLINISLVDDLGNPVGSASVSMKLTLGTKVWSGSGSTNSDGIASFRLRNASDGCYTTEVTNVSASGPTWDGLSPDNEFCKTSSSSNKGNSEVFQSQ